jgi:broad specificity phosphatase PhoE
MTRLLFISSSLLICQTMAWLPSLSNTPSLLSTAQFASRFSGVVTGVLMNSLTRSKHATEGRGFAGSLPQLEPECKRLYLLRHGQTEWNLQGLLQGGGYDIPLNSQGRQQARLASNELARIPLDTVVSSHLSRAKQTADTLYSKHPSASRLVRPEFSEMSFGEFEGVKTKGPDATPEIKRQVQLQNFRMAQNRFHSWPGGESAHHVEARARRALDEILQTHRNDKHIAIVGHSRTNKILLSSLLVNDVTKHLEIPQGNACINVVDFNEKDGTWKNVLLNYVDHAIVPNSNSVLSETIILSFLSLRKKLRSLYFQLQLLLLRPKTA